MAQRKKFVMVSGLLLLMVQMLAIEVRYTYLLHTEFMVCGRPYAFLFDMDYKGSDSEILLYEGIIGFYNPASRKFTAFGHPVLEEEKDVGQKALVFEVEEQKAGKLVGDIYKNTDGGCFGKFREGYKPFEYASMKVMPLGRIHEGTACLLMLDENHQMVEYTGNMTLKKNGFPVELVVTDENFPGAGPGCSGSIVLQDGKIAAIVCAGKEGGNTKKLFAIPAAYTLLQF